jgi:hypothetical protein
MDKIKLFFISFFVILVFFSCDLEEPDDGTISYPKSSTPVTSITDSRLVGTFRYYNSWKTPSSRRFISDTYRFDGTDKVYNSYRSGYTTGYDTTSYTFNYEFEFDNGKYRKKLYQNPYSDWYEWEEIYFSSDGNHLYMEGNWYDKN